MKNIGIGLLLLLGTQLALAKSHVTKTDIMGVWKLTKFYLEDSNGYSWEWCEGATGTIAYLPHTMSVGINCEYARTGSNAAKLDGKLFYSGHFEFNHRTQKVLHRVRNYSHPSLNQTYTRSVEMDHENHLRLIGNLSPEVQAIVEWERIESIGYDLQPLSGVWELVGSENEVAGSDETIPFCTGFYGTFLFTPGGYTAVSINCAEKSDRDIQEPADQFGRHFFYSGRYQVTPSELVVIPDNASEPQQIGHPGVRAMKIKGDLLILTGTNGSNFVAKWRKVSSFIGL